MSLIILPYLEQNSAYQGWLGPSGTLLGYVSVSAATQQTTVPVYFCPARKPNRLSVGVGGGNNNDERDPAAGACGDYAACSGNDPNTVSSNWQLANGAIVTELVKKLSFANIIDGLSNTLFVGEKHVNANSLSTTIYDSSIYNSDSANSCQRVAGPSSLLAKSVLDPDASIFGGPHKGVVPFLFGDGGVRCLSVTTNGTLLGWLAQRDDGQVVDLSGL